MRTKNEQEISRKMTIPTKMPNTETRAAIVELEAGKGKRAATIHELMAELKEVD